MALSAGGVRHDGTEEFTNFRVADSESEESWTAFMTDLEMPGVSKENAWAQRVQMIVSDGDQGLCAAPAMVYPNVPRQRCIFHKLQDIAAHLHDRDHRETILSSAGQIYDDLQSRHWALYRLGQRVKGWQDLAPEAVRAFSYEFEDTLTYVDAPLEADGYALTRLPAAKGLFTPHTQPYRLRLRKGLDRRGQSGDNDRTDRSVPFPDVPRRRAARRLHEAGPIGACGGAVECVRAKATLRGDPAPG